MPEYKAWVVVDRSGEPQDVWVGGPPTGWADGSRVVEGTLTIPDEPEWKVRFFPDGGISILSPDKYMVSDPNIDVIVRAPDAQAALALAIAKRDDK